MQTGETEQVHQEGAVKSVIRVGDKIGIKIEPLLLMLLAMLAGALWGALLVLFDPWLRFPDFPMRANWREALFAGAVMGGYAALLSWLITAFWRSAWLWLVSAGTVPLVTAGVMTWNINSAAFGGESDFIMFLPFVLILHMAIVAMVVVFLLLGLRLPWRRAAAYGAIPLVLALVIVLVLVPFRRDNQEALEVVYATDQYASGIFGETDYEIEFLGIRYRERVAPEGNTRVHSADQTLACRVRLFGERTETECRTE